MKKLLLSAVALVAAMSINAQVFQMDGEAHGLTSELSNVEAGHVWGSIEGALDISNAFETQHLLVDCMSDDFTKVIIDGNEILTKGGVRGNDTPKDGEGGNPAVTFQQATSGAVIRIDAKKDGWVYIVAKLSTNKQYMVFEEGLPIGYKIAMESNNEAIPNGVLNLEIKGEGEYNNLSPDQYPDGLKWVIREFTGDPEAASAGNGLGVFYFPVAKDCEYRAHATGSKIMWCGVYFSETEAKSVFVEGGGTFRNLISNDGVASDIWTIAGDKSLMGSDWDASSRWNTMHSLDGVNYTLTKRDVFLIKGVTYNFKVVRNHDWEESYPSDKATLMVEENAVYTITFNFNVETKELTASTEKTDGIYYNYITKGKIAEVIQNPNGYKGDIVIPETVTHDGVEYRVTAIGNEAFIICSGLSSVTIPDGVTSIGTSAFAGCIGLTSVIIPNSVTKIGNNAFKNCSGLASVIIGNSVIDIGSSAFEYCSGLTSVTIPNSVISIGDYAFFNCNGLTSVIIPNSVTSIGNRAFYDCNGLTSVHISDLEAWCNIKFVDNPLSYAHHLYLGEEEIKDLVIPNNVISIGNYAFVGCSGLTSVTIPNSVTSIGNSAFFGCSGLTSVTIPNSVTSIGYSTFSGCSSLTSVTIPNSVTSLGWSAFEGCSGLTSVTIPSSVTFIEDGTFSGCSGLTSVNIPNSITFIGGRAFFGCSGLTSVTIPNSVTSIGGSAFQGCSGLTSVTIGSGVTFINNSAFEDCPELTNVYCYAEQVPATKAKVFEGSYIDYATLYVPASAVESYKATAPWSGFKEIVKIDKFEYTLTYKVDGEVYKEYSLEEGETITPEAEPTKEGYTFSGWSEIPETMPAHDVTVMGSFTLNKYKLTYIVDGVDYKSYEIEYGAKITPESEPIKEGYTFSGWSEIPSTMPAKDVTVYGTFTVNKYKLTYLVDNEVYRSYDVEYGATITPEEAPTKENYIFSGWSDIPETMPAHDVTITGSFERRYDVGNVTSLISFILRGNGGSDDLALYDMNGDGVLNIGDLILIVRKVLNNTKRSAITRVDMNCLAPDFTQYSAAQFVLNVPENVREQDICLVEGIKQTHQMMCKQIEPGAYAVVVYSLTNSLFMPNNGNIVEVNTGKAHSDDLSIQDVMLAKPTGETKLYGYMPVRTSISDVEKENEHRHVYNLKGQKQSRVNGLQKGVYIENGKKIVVR